MKRELKLDKAIYLVDGLTRTYRFLKRNLEGKDLDSNQNEANEKHIEGYTRIFRAGRTQIYKGILG